MNQLLYELALMPIRRMVRIDYVHRFDVHHSLYKLALPIANTTYDTN